MIATKLKAKPLVVANTAANVGSLDAYAVRGIITVAEMTHRSGPEPTMPTYEENPKHGPRQRGTSKGVASKAPTSGQAALDNSIQVKPTSPRRVGVDKANGEIVVLDEHLPGRFHGHVRDWDQLTPQIKDALARAGLTNRQGRII